MFNVIHLSNNSALRYNYAPFYSSATDEDFYSSLAQMAGEDFDGDDDDEVTKMGVCRVHACLQGWYNGFQIP